MEEKDQDPTENKHRLDAEQTTNVAKEGTPDIADEDMIDILMTSEGDISMDIQHLTQTARLRKGTKKHPPEGENVNSGPLEAMLHCTKAETKTK